MRESNDDGNWLTLQRHIVISMNLDFLGMAQSILDLLPDTQHLAIWRRIRLCP